MTGEERGFSVVNFLERHHTDFECTDCCTIYYGHYVPVLHTVINKILT